FSEDANGTQESSEVAPVNENDEAGSVGGIEISNQPTEPQIRPDEDEAVLESEVGADDTNVAVESVQEPTEEAGEAGGESGRSESMTAEPVADTTNADESPAENSEPTESQPAEAEVATTEPAETEQVVTEQAAPTEASAASLVLEFSEECWVKIDDVSGETQAVGVKAAGYRMPVPGNAPFSVTLCKPEAVKVSFNGNDVDMSEFRSGRVARFTVPSEE
ncbi:MAG: DUF4115 domain-containing protein, partial [Idiomarina sp.]|nr:DUF4115 domain-containing protein [Idiomarina sp.]